MNIMVGMMMLDRNCVLKFVWNSFLFLIWNLFSVFFLCLKIFISV